MELYLISFFTYSVLWVDVGGVRVSVVVCAQATCSHYIERCATSDTREVRPRTTCSRCYGNRYRQPEQLTEGLLTFSNIDDLLFSRLFLIRSIIFLSIILKNLNYTQYYIFTIYLMHLRKLQIWLRDQSKSLHIFYILYVIVSYIQFITLSVYFSDKNVISYVVTHYDYELFIYPVAGILEEFSKEINSSIVLICLSNFFF